MSKIDGYIRLLNRWDVHDEAGARNMLSSRGIPEKWMDDIIEDLKKLGTIICDEPEPEPEVVEDYSDNPLRNTFKKGMAWVFKRKGSMKDGRIMMKKFDFISAVSMDLQWFSFAEGELFLESMGTLGLVNEIGDEWYDATFDIDETYERDCLNGAWDFMEEMGLERGAEARRIREEYEKQWKKEWRRLEKLWKGSDGYDDVHDDEIDDDRVSRKGIIDELSGVTGIDKKIISECFDYEELNYGLNHEFFFRDLAMVGKRKDLSIIHKKLSEVFGIDS